MNALCYKIVFSKRLGALVAVGEHTSGQGKAAGTGVRTAVYPSSAVGATGGEFVGSLKAVFASVALTCFTATTIAAGTAANTLPTGYSVNNGNVTVSTSGADMTIKQTTDKASVNWQSFSIGSAASVNIQQNSASSVLLNRVVGNDPSQIFGKLTANGQVILINPNGIVFGKGGSVTASAFTASTFGMTDADFSAGKHKFNRNGRTAGVTVEQGANISTTAPGGYVALIGASVDNQGAITTKEGAVVLVAGESVALPAAMTDSVGIPLSSKVRLELAPSTINASVVNGGTITTEGGQVLMQAAALSDAVASITHTGTIDTTGVQGGAVTLQADHGIIKATGTIKANSKNAKNKGGDIYIGRDEVTGVLAKTTNVSGATLESQGGFVETSGDYLETKSVRVKAKDWLLDPTDITIVGNVSSGSGGYTNTTPSVTGPDITYAPSTSSTVFASDIAASLNDGTNVILQTTGIAGDNLGAGNIAVNENITKTGGGDATLTLKAHNNITVAAGKSISSSSNKLNVMLNSDSDGNGEGTIAMNNGSSINSNAGNISFGGGSIGASNTEYAQSASGVGIYLGGTTINAGTGTFIAKGKSRTAQGVLFSGTNAITAAQYIIDGQSTNGAAIYMGNGTTTFNSTGNELASNIQGTSQTGRGVFIQAGNLNFNTNNGSKATFSSGNGEMRLGWNKGVTLNTNGDVTLGSHANNTVGLTFQADAFVTGKLTLMGKATGGNHGIFFTEGGGSGARIVGTNATVKFDGISEGSGSGVHLHPAGVANSLSSIGTGSFEIIGTSTTGSGVRVGATTITSGGLTKITGVSKGGTGDGVTSTGVIDAGSIEILGTAVGGRGVVIGATHTAKIGDVYIDGTSTSTIASEVYGAINANGVNANITLLGTSQNSVGIQLASTLTAKNLVTVTGESKANTTGTFFTGTSGVDAASYQVKGTSATATGINIDGGTVTFKSSSTTADSRIEGKGAAWGIQKRSGTLNLTNNGNAKVTMQSAFDSTGGGLLIGIADGLTVNTKGDVTIGSTHNNALLTIQRTIFNANGGNLSIKGKSASNGITMQDGGGNPVQIVGTNGANIVLEGQSSVNGIGIHMGNGNSGAAHSITTNGTVTLTGKSENGFGINTYSSTITGSNVNIKADTLAIGSTINAGTVSIKTATSGKEINIGANDVSTSGNQKLELSQDELGRIKATNLVIGDTASNGKITVIGTTETTAATGDITLQTAGDIAFLGGLNVGGTTPTKKLTLNAGGKVTQNATAAIRATELQLLGTNAEYKLNSTTNSVGKIAGSAKIIEYTNAGELSIDTVDGIQISQDTQTDVSSKGIETTGGAHITTQTGNLNINKAVSNSTDGDITLGAGVIWGISEGSNQNIKTTDNAKVTNTADGKKTFLYTGSAGGTGTLSKLHDSLSELYLDGSTSDKAQNADSGVKLGTKINSPSAATQVLFREKVNVSIQENLKGATQAQEYGLDNSKKGNETALWNSVQSAMKASNSVNGISNQLTSTQTDANGNNIKFHVSAATVINDMTGTIQNAAYSQNGFGYLKANTQDNGNTNGYSYNIPLVTGKYTVKFEDNAKVKVMVEPKKLTGTFSSGASSVYSESFNLGSVTFNNIAQGDGGISGTTQIKAADMAGKTSSSGNLKAGTYTNIRSVSAITGDDSSNYTFADVKGDYTVNQKPLTALYAANNKEFDGNTNAVVTATLKDIIAGDKVTANHTSAKFSSPDVGTNISVTVEGISLVGSDASNYKVNPATNPGNKATSSASITARTPTPPTPVVPTNNAGGRVKIPTGSANPFALASAEDLADDTCSANSIENCHCEESTASQGVNICYESKSASKSSAR